ncbi:MAG: GIY-YIG nuclease family protein [Myxococcales bacterium]|nr:GIY-YIG nuclease family protein [Myxococcales bacterium]
MSEWQVYVLLSADGRRTYVGVTTDLERRLAQHNGERPGGARATRQGRPWSLGVSHGPLASRAEAQRIEARLKRRRHRERLRALPELAADAADAG